MIYTPFLMSSLCWLMFITSAISAETQEALTSKEIRVRPPHWAQPIVGTQLENFHIIGPGVYRSGQPSAKDLKLLVEKMGFKSVLCLRDLHDDSDEAEGLPLALYRVEMEADDIETDKIARALQIIQDAPKPILIHCWHGADRTGLVAASYRIAVQNWEPVTAVDELFNGGFGYHHKMFPGIAKWLQSGEIKPGQPFTGKKP